mmetsp:Transcript_7991/g.10096  ORF Transcript_7991/g.10096 Transcript_7991/m.10096 type:complete len:205 (+) Transcript_7991:189-803(+)
MCTHIFNPECLPATRFFKLWRFIQQTDSFNNNHYLHRHSMRTTNSPDDVNQPFSHYYYVLPSVHTKASAPPSYSSLHKSQPVLPIPKMLLPHCTLSAQTFQSVELVLPIHPTLLSHTIPPRDDEAPASPPRVDQSYSLGEQMGNQPHFHSILLVVGTPLSNYPNCQNFSYRQHHTRVLRHRHLYRMPHRDFEIVLGRLCPIFGV